MDRIWVLHGGEDFDDGIHAVRTQKPTVDKIMDPVQIRPNIVLRLSNAVW
jgi:hypothetical protein